MCVIHMLSMLYVQFLCYICSDCIIISCNNKVHLNKICVKKHLARKKYFYYFDFSFLGNVSSKAMNFHPKPTTKTLRWAYASSTIKFIHSNTKRIIYLIKKAKQISAILTESGKLQHYMHGNRAWSKTQTIHVDAFFVWKWVYRNEFYWFEVKILVKGYIALMHFDSREYRRGVPKMRGRVPVKIWAKLLRIF